MKSLNKVLFLSAMMVVMSAPAFALGESDPACAGQQAAKCAPGDTSADCKKAEVVAPPAGGGGSAAGATVKKDGDK